MHYFKHELANVNSDNIGNDTKIWQFSVVVNGAVIGSNCNICSHCFIEGAVSIGNNVTIKAGVYLWDGITIDNDVFVGPNVVFTNDIYPRSKQFKTPATTHIQQGVSLGANSTILAGTTLGMYAMTGIGSVVTKNLKSYGLYFGNPATHKGWVNEYGEKLSYSADKNVWCGADNNEYKETPTGLIKL